MQKLVINNLKFRSLHGCWPEERKLGGKFAVNIELFGDFNTACESDNISDAVDYVTVSQIAEEEMAIPSDLIEHVAKRVGDRLKSTFGSVEKVVVEVRKFNVPISQDLDYVSFFYEG